jgi:CRP/FNR family transcriptional regulator, cyclic AMP receptor protein
MNSPMDREKAPELDAAGKNRCELDKNLDILRRVPAFSGIPIERLKLYAYLSNRMHFRAGDFVFRQGEQGDLGYVVICGKGQVIRELKDHSILLNEFGEGDFFGGLVLLSDTERLFSVRAKTDLECLTIDRETFQKLFLQFPEAALKMVSVMLKRIMQMEEKLLQAKAEDFMYG